MAQKQPSWSTIVDSVLNHAQESYDNGMIKVRYQDQDTRTDPRNIEVLERVKLQGGGVPVDLLGTNESDVEMVQCENQLVKIYNSITGGDIYSGQVVPCVDHLQNHLPGAPRNMAQVQNVGGWGGSGWWGNAPPLRQKGVAVAPDGSEGKKEFRIL